MYTQATENTDLTVHVQDDASIDDKRETLLKTLLEGLNAETDSFN